MGDSSGFIWLVLQTTPPFDDGMKVIRSKLQSHLKINKYVSFCMLLFFYTAYKNPAR